MNKHRFIFTWLFFLYTSKISDVSRGSVFACTQLCIPYRIYDIDYCFSSSHFFSLWGFYEWIFCITIVNSHDSYKMCPLQSFINPTIDRQFLKTDEISWSMIMLKIILECLIQWFRKWYKKIWNDNYHEKWRILLPSVSFIWWQTWSWRLFILRVTLIH